MNAREDVNFISINEYVYRINCDSVINVLVLNRLINIMYHRFKSVSRKRSRFNSISFIEYHINTKSRKYDVMIDLTFFRIVKSFNLFIKI